MLGKSAVTISGSGGGTPGGGTLDDTILALSPEYYFRFDDNGGVSSISDSSGNSHTATMFLTGSTTTTFPTTTGISAQAGDAFASLLANYHAEIDNSETWNPSGDFSVVVAVTVPTSNRSNEPIVGKWGGTDISWIINDAPSVANRIDFVIRSGGTNRTISLSVTDNGQFILFVFTYEAGVGTKLWYNNGVNGGSLSVTTPIDWGNTSKIVAGGYTDKTVSTWSGTIEFLSIHPSVLTQSDCQDIWAQCSDDTEFFSDGFSGNFGTNITAHTPDIGTSWSYSPYNQVSNGISISSSGTRVYFPLATSTSWAMATPSLTPTSADVSVKVDIYYAVSASNDQAGVTLGVRTANQATRQGYICELFSGVFQILRFDAGSATNLGTWTPTGFSVGNTWKVELKAVGSTISLVVNDVERISVTDSTYSSAGLVMMGGRERTSGEIHVNAFHAEEL